MLRREPVTVYVTDRYFNDAHRTCLDSSIDVRPSPVGQSAPRIDPVSQFASAALGQTLRLQIQATTSTGRPLIYQLASVRCVTATGGSGCDRGVTVTSSGQIVWTGDGLGSQGRIFVIFAVGDTITGAYGWVELETRSSARRVRRTGGGAPVGLRAVISSSRRSRASSESHASQIYGRAA